MTALLIHFWHSLSCVIFEKRIMLYIVMPVAPNLYQGSLFPIVFVHIFPYKRRQQLINPDIVPFSLFFLFVLRIRRTSV